MRTSIEIDDELLTEAMAATGQATKQAAAEEALRRVVLRQRRLDAMADMAGLGWEGDLDAMREGRSSDAAPCSSVWIANLRGLDTPAVRTLRSRTRADSGSILVGDLILLEVLQGARDEANAARIERNMREYAVVPMLDDAVAVQAARAFRALRAKGVTIGKTADLIIGTFCIAYGYELLHDDRDFEPMATHLGLRVA